MKAIYNNVLYNVKNDDGKGLLLDPVEDQDGESHYVQFGDSSLIVDPTDDQIEALGALPDPVDDPYTPLSNDDEGYDEDGKCSNLSCPDCYPAEYDDDDDWNDEGDGDDD